MSFGDRLRSARVAKGYTQEQLATIIGVAKSTLTGYEKGNREPDVEKIRALAKALGVTGDELLGIASNSPEGNEKATRDDVESGLVAVLSSLGIRKEDLTVEKVKLIRNVVQAIVESDAKEQ